MTTTSDYTIATANRSDVPDAEQPVRWISPGAQSFNFQRAPSLTLSTDVPELPERRRPAQAFIEKMVEDYAEAAMRHVWTYQGPDGTWVGEVVGLEGAWSEGETEEKARASLLDIIFDWAMYKIADSDGDIPVLDGIDLNTL